MYVTDMAGILSKSDLENLERRLQEFDVNTSNQFVVLILPSLEGEALEDVSMRVAELNSIGWKGRDNGLLFIMSVQDRQMRFEVGYGLEGVLTDALTSTIIRDLIAPRFKENDYAGGISQGMSAAMSAARGEFTAIEKPREKKQRGKGVGNLVFILIMLFIIMRAARMGRKGRGGGIWFIGPFSGFGGSSGGGGFGGGGFGGFSGGGGSFGGGGSSGSW
jgi:uncharacterized protein